MSQWFSQKFVLQKYKRSWVSEDSYLINYVSNYVREASTTSRLVTPQDIIASPATTFICIFSFGYCFSANYYTNVEVIMDAACLTCKLEVWQYWVFIAEEMRACYDGWRRVEAHLSLKQSAKCVHLNLGCEWDIDRLTQVSCSWVRTTFLNPTVLQNCLSQNYKGLIGIKSQRLDLPLQKHLKCYLCMGNRHVTL